MPLDALRDRLLRRHCPRHVRDEVWAYLVERSRQEGGSWTVGCVGVALPALTRIASELSRRFAGDPSDIHAAVLTGFLTELAHIDLRRPGIMTRLRWAAYRAGHTALRESLDAPVPSGSGFRSTEPAPPWGHPDFVLARAVAEGVITAAEAELIGATRLEGLPLQTAAEQRGVSYEAIKKTRRRAELRLAAYLRTELATDASEGDLAGQAADSITLTTARPRRVRGVRGEGANARGGVSPGTGDGGVQGCGGGAARAPQRSADEPTAAPEVPRCA
ncbi:hypothetical protein F1721_32815 [Saccharopolyspora hirsuta]|uniref:Uncharacterized protein n=1 Tax=Saccharopolyspora hirsuta TaxID=1837 RepID=A0A5M7B798_SACHI|nr:hypothetical protein F1721_32815 [Saccharopolyspora hirsuta]